LRTVDDKMFFQLLVFFTVKIDFQSFMRELFKLDTLGPPLGYSTLTLIKKNSMYSRNSLKTMIPFNRVRSRYFCNLGLFFILRVFITLEDVKLVSIAGSMCNTVDAQSFFSLCTYHAENW
jgi:hypothetical protein